MSGGGARPTPRPAYVCRSVPRWFDLSLLHAAQPRRYPHLLESVAHGTPQARFDILFAFPGAALELRSDGRLYQDGAAIGATPFLTTFERVWRSAAARAGRCPEPEALPFTGGWFVFLAYELAGEIEPRLAHVPRDANLPLALAVRFPAAVVRDHAQDRIHLVAEGAHCDALIAAMEHDMTQLALPGDGAIEVAAVREDEPERYLHHVERIKRYIAAGDVFQVNLARRWQIRLAAPTPPVHIYRQLRRTNPAPFAGLMTWPDGGALISSSPERLVQIENGMVRTRPIAGTYPRSENPAQDRAWSQDLLAHPKERAEHVMLIDLERNDLGRVCRAGSVQVNELMVLESYRHVHHIVSEVRGELRAAVTPMEVIRAVFPGGTITGCPKVRCMEIIAELEAAPRAAYTGAMGYINHDGRMDLNILIRTLVQQGDNLALHAGAGIVADSVPARELAETRAKAKGLLAALGLA